MFTANQGLNVVYGFQRLFIGSPTFATTGNSDIGAAGYREILATGFLLGRMIYRDVNMSVTTLTQAIWLLLSSCLFSVVAFAGDAEHSPSVALTFPLQTVALPEGTTLAVELDGYDVSPFASFSATHLLLSLETPLAAGEHGLMVLAFLPNGDIETLLEQPVVVAPEQEHSRQWGANVTLDSSYRVGQKNKQEYQSVRHLASQSALALRGQERQGAWQMDAEIDALYDSVSEHHEGDSEWALPNYRLSLAYQGERTSGDVSVGSVRVERDDLLFSVFQRRGASVRVGTSDGTTAVTLFEVNTEPTTRIRGDLVLAGDDSHKGQGVTFTSELAGRALSVNGGYIEGKTTLGGGGVYIPGEVIEYGGDSWNAGLDSHLLEESLWLHMEYAESSFDHDGIDQGLEAETDSALQAVAQLSSGALPAGWFDYWSGTLQYQEVGRDFYSLGNLSLPGDLALSRFVAQVGKQGIALGLELSEERNNLDDNAEQATQTLLRQGVNVSYTPMSIDPSTWLWATLGTPSISANYMQVDHSQPAADALVVGFDLDSQTRDAGVNFMFNRQAWNWTVQFQQTQVDDRSEAVEQNGYLTYQPGSDIRNNMMGLQLGWFASARASVNLFMQLNQRTETDFDNRFNNRNLGIDGYFQLIPDTLILALNYNFGTDTSRLADPFYINNDFQSHFGNAQLTWKALQAMGNTPGVNVYLKSSYGRQDNRAYALVQEQWSAHIGFELAWAVGEI